MPGGGATGHGTGLGGTTAPTAPWPSGTRSFGYASWRYGEASLPRPRWPGRSGAALVCTLSWPFRSA